MAQQTAMQTLIAWGDEMLLKHPQKILSFGDAIDKAIELLQMEKEQIMKTWEDRVSKLPEPKGYMIDFTSAEQYYNGTYERKS